jgi:hypothetical protein
VSFSNLWKPSNLIPALQTHTQLPTRLLCEVGYSTSIFNKETSLRCWLGRLTQCVIISCRFLEVDIDIAMQRVLGRHIKTGKPPDIAEWRVSYSSGLHLSLCSEACELSLSRGSFGRRGPTLETRGSGKLQNLCENLGCAGVPRGFKLLVLAPASYNSFDVSSWIRFLPSLQECPHALNHFCISN